MNPETQQILYEKIKTEIAKTEDLVRSLEDKAKPISPDNAIGRISRMDAIGNKSVTDASLSNARTKITRLKYALDNLDRPGFGCCVECEEEIPIGRIMVMPESILCVRCAEETE